MEKCRPLVRTMEMVSTASWLGSFGDMGEVLDEGGVRCRHDDVVRYVPYLQILELRVERALIQRRLVVEIAGDRVIAALPVGLDTTSLCEVIAHRRAQARATATRLHAIRGELAVWIATVSASSISQADRGGCYRMSSVDDRLLEETLADPTDDASARAAAAHALLARGRDDLVSPRIGKGTPPLVVAAARLGRGGDAIVSDALLARVFPFLELRDRVVFAQRARISLVA